MATFAFNFDGCCWLMLAMVGLAGCHAVDFYEPVAATAGAAGDGAAARTGHGVAAGLPRRAARHPA